MQSIDAFKADFSFLFCVGDEMSIIEKINDAAMWQQFLEHKQSNNNMSDSEEKAIIEFIENEKFTYYYEQLKNSTLCDSMDCCPLGLSVHGI